MSKFFNIVKFELGAYFKQKGYIISTIVMTLILIVGLSLPSFIDLSGVIPGLESEDKVEETDKDKEKDEVSYAILDSKDIVIDLTMLETVFPESKWQEVDSKDEMKELVNSEEVEAGFIVEDINKYEYLVVNKSMHDSNQILFEEVLRTINKINYAAENGLDFNEMEKEINLEIKTDVEILGKNSEGNFFYVYILVFVIYFMTIMYGQLIAMSVTSEKSNRTMEVLVTSATCNTLICGKVLSAVIASVVQIVATLGVGIVTYSINRSAWNGILDKVFEMPTDILITFGFFGIIGIVFYAFIFGALGALVSKTEDIGSSIAPINFIFMISFFISMFGLMGNADNIVVKIASFVPFSAPMIMLVRVAMGTISTIEIVISLIILIVSTVGMAIVAAKVYRMGTLRYGNPIKLKSVFKIIKSEKLEK